MAAPIVPGSADSTSNPRSEVGLYRVGPIVMREGITRKHLWTLFFVSFFSIAMMNSVGIMQAYLFNEILKIPPNEQGSLTGTLLVVQELVVILLVGVAGALSDRVGRPPVFATGFLLLALGYCLYPLASGDLETVRWELVFFRLFIASGVACVNVMLSSVANDYPIDRTRARRSPPSSSSTAWGSPVCPGWSAGCPRPSSRWVSTRSGRGAMPTGAWRESA